MARTRIVGAITMVALAAVLLIRRLGGLPRRSADEGAPRRDPLDEVPGDERVRFLQAAEVVGEMTVYLRSSGDVQSIDDMVDQSDFEAKFTIRERVDGAGVGHIGNRSRAYLETIDRDVCWPLSGGALSYS